MKFYNLIKLDANVGDNVYNLYNSGVIYKIVKITKQYIYTSEGEHYSLDGLDYIVYDVHGNHYVGKYKGYVPIDYIEYFVWDIINSGVSRIIKI
jgi:hypothetical protein